MRKDICIDLSRPDCQFFVRQHWRSYIAAALMLASISVLICIEYPEKSAPSSMDWWRNAWAATHCCWNSHNWRRWASRFIFCASAGACDCLPPRTGSASSCARGCTRGCRCKARSFFQRQRTGDLMALATNDIDAVEMAAGEAMLAGFDGTLTLVMVLAIMSLGVDWRLTLIALLPFPLMACAFWRISRHVHAGLDAMSLKRFSALNDHVQETLSGVRTVRALGLRAAQRRRSSRTGRAARPMRASTRSAGKRRTNRRSASRSAAATVLTLGAGRLAGVAGRADDRRS